MKRVKSVILAFAAMVAVTATAQDFSDPQYAKWGDTPEQRKENILASTFLKEELANRNYNSAAGYLQQLIERCPGASENIYANGIKLYKMKINRARSLAEKNSYVDSLLWLYDVRLKHYAAHPKRGAAYILERKAREHLTYRESDREGVRKDFEAAIASQIENNGTADPELVVIYFKNLCDDYTNDVVDAMTVVNAYDANSKFFEQLTAEQADLKNQFENCFGASGAANCDNIKKIFESRISAAPNDEALLAQAFSLLKKAGCDNDFYFTVGELYYGVSQKSEVAMLLAQAFQNKKEYAKANEYLRKALEKETDNAEREKLYVRIGILEMTTNNYAEAIGAFKEAGALNPENGYVPYFLAQCYVASSKDCSAGLVRDAVHWVAYDLMQQAIPALETTDADVAATAKNLATSYRAAFPTAEECFFAEMKEGSSYTLRCSLAKGVTTKVRYRAQ